MSLLKEVGAAFGGFVSEIEDGASVTVTFAEGVWSKLKAEFIAEGGNVPQIDIQHPIAEVAPPAEETPAIEEVATPAAEVLTPEQIAEQAPPDA